MPETVVLFLAACLFAAAALYTSVGHAGASAYIAVMALFGVAPAVMRPSTGAQHPGRELHVVSLLARRVIPLAYAVALSDRSTAVRGCWRGGSIAGPVLSATCRRNLDHRWHSIPVAQGTDDQ